MPKKPMPSMKKNTQRKISSDEVELFNIGFLKLNSFAPEIRRRMAEKSSKHPFFRVHFLLLETVRPSGVFRKYPHRI